jgi:hypothetical protein
VLHELFWCPCPHILPCCHLLHHTVQFAVQTAAGDEAEALCRGEVQAFMKYFARPLAEQCVRRRLRRENMQSPVPTYKVSRKAAMGGEAVISMQTLQQIHDFWKMQVEGAYTALVNGRWQPFAGVPMQAYKPRGQHVAFQTLDNAGMHSWYEGVRGRNRKHLADPGFSLLQLPTLPPNGHDAHQIVEHAIGVTKGGAEKELKVIRDQGRTVYSEDLHDAMVTAAKQFDADSYARGILKLEQCLRVVAAEKDQEVKVVLYKVQGRRAKHAPVQVVEQEWVTQGTAGGFPPKCLA